MTITGSAWVIETAIGFLFRDRALADGGSSHDGLILATFNEGRWYAHAIGLDVIAPIYDSVREARYRAALDRIWSEGYVSDVRCDDCGARPGAGCDCASNRKAIGRGERAKAAREEC